MRACAVCGATDRQKPLVTFPVKIDGETEERMRTTCSDHVFTTTAGEAQA